MPPRSKVSNLPDEVRRWLDGALAAGNFSGYEQLEKLLTERGYTIGKSSLQRYGKGLELRLAAVKASTEAARAIAEAAPDDADLRSSAVMSLVQTDIFNVLIQLQEVAAEDDPKDRLKLMSSAAKSIAELSRASVNQKKWQADLREKTRVAADAVAQVAKKGGLTSEAVEVIRREILGIVS